MRPYILMNLGTPASEIEEETIKRQVMKASPRAVAEILKHLLFEYELKDKNLCEVESLIIAGEKDTLAEPVGTKRLMKYFKDPKFILVKYAGHMNMINMLTREHGKEIVGWLAQ